jgi:restriction endonuclease S subunit
MESNNEMQKNKKTYLQFISLIQLENWSSYALLGKNLIYTQKYPFVKIGDFLKRIKTQVEIEDGVLYKRATIRINGNGISLRDNIEVDGKNIGTKNQFRIKTGQFLLSKIDARNGAFGVVPEELDNGIITGNFWTFDVDYSKINPYYLTLLTGTKKFQELSQTASVGTTNRNYLQETSFLNFEIPLPSLAEQERIVNAYNEKIEQVRQLKKEADDLGNGVETYLFNELGVDNGIIKTDKKANFLDFINYQDIERWALSYIFKNQLFSFKKVKYDIHPLKCLLKSFDGGKTPSTSKKEYWDGDVNWFSAKDMKSLRLSESKDKITTYAVKDTGMKIHPIGTILGVFRSGILRHSFPVALLEKPATINQDLKAMVFDNNQIDNHYALYYMHIFQKLILEQAQKTGVTVESINTDEFMEIPFVVPPLETQKVLVKSIAEMESKIFDSKQNAELNKEIAQKEFESEIFGV